MTATTAAAASARVNPLTTGQLPAWSPWAILLGSWVLVGGVFALMNTGGDPADFNIAATLFLGTVLFVVLLTVFSSVAENRRRAVDRLVTSLVSSAFVIVLIPLVSLLYTVVVNGLDRFDAEFFSSSMRNIVGEGGGAVHAIWGTLLITLGAAVISVPIGLMTAIYLVEYGRGKLAKAITFLVDVMTGIPSIVAGLFAAAVFVIFFGPGTYMGIAGSVALSVLMIPVVVRSSEEMLRLVPNELREASYALGVPKWLTIMKVVMPTSIAGITTGVTLAISRVIGETAPLVLTAGITASLNTNLFSGPMTTLPVLVFSQYRSPGIDPTEALDRAWAGALTLILIVMALNLVARLVAKIFAPKLGR
ncbi:phosphate ABC transporter permease PstA [Arenivirga flava]|uniref:Phosphate transport system permease protein PstA n=1 Tax=Arenivirga flava TaxID=1930060 RepID=A0AA37UI17_9MICO|nr:phosphate ABC transporter permease PstA [Arenivirga flava]GMA29344.1 phosphate transport system permease protein PstA [Arenivirga flava]